MAQEYPKEVKLKDGSKVVLRLFEKRDVDAQFAFFTKLPEEDRLFLRDDVVDRAVVSRWAAELNYDKVYPVLAFRGDEVVGSATLHKNRGGWMRHVGSIRVVTAREFQKKGLGGLLAKELFYHALKAGLEKISAEMMDTQPGAKKVFEKLGFVQEAVLKGYVCDQIGVRHDLLILTKDLEQFWTDIADHEYLTYPAHEME